VKFIVEVQYMAHMRTNSVMHIVSVRVQSLDAVYDKKECLVTISSRKTLHEAM
jgi:hypothetical protein